jgi:hypothetical protein
MKHLRLYIHSLLREMAAPSTDHSNTVYYHGTPTVKNAKSIMLHGVKPPDLSDRTGNLRPVDGKVYITPSIAYAQMYALGGNMAGHDTSMFEKDYGRYGYVFVINGKDLKDIQPDEDSIGEMIYNEEISWLNQMAEYYLQEEPYDDGGQGLGFANLYDALMNGEFDAMATGGRYLVDEMSDEEKLSLIDAGAHIAHAGLLMPMETYRIDRKKSKLLKSDGSNFFEIAEKVK